MEIKDKIDAKDLNKKPGRELLIMIYMQTIKTNGIIADHERRIHIIEKLVNDKIGLKLFKNISIALGTIMILFTILNIIIDLLVE